MPTPLELVRHVIADVPLLAARVQALAARPGWTRRADVHLSRLHRALGADDGLLRAACEDFCEMTIETLRLQHRFWQGGQPGARPPAEVHALRADATLMPGRYLNGLYLSQVLWENHYQRLELFFSRFLPLLPAAGHLADLGSGPGTTAVLAAAARPALAVVAADASPWSGEFLARLCRADSLPPVEFRCGRFEELFRGEDGRYDAAVFCDVVEHLDDPGLGLIRLRALLRPGGLVFFSTATNAAFYDHTIAFDDTAGILRLLEAHGFAVRASWSVPVMAGPEGRDLVDFDAILEVRS